MPILIINDKDDERSGMRSEMRDSMSMRGGSGMRHYPMHYKEGQEYKEGYCKGYKEGWEDAEKELSGDQFQEEGQMREDYRRQRDRMGRYK